jgi:hypothetical protein
MLNSAVLDLVILLTFTYFIGSLLLSAINESLTQGIWKLRQKNLKTALENLFFDGAWKGFVDNTLLKSPHIQSLAKGVINEKENFPAYVPANNFILALIEQIGSANYSSATLQNAIGNSQLPLQLKTVLQNIAAKADNKIEGFEKGVEQFYNDAMDRAGGWYKKEVRRILLILGFVLSALLNIDTLKISTDALSEKKALKENVDKIVMQLPNIQLTKNGDQSTVTIKDGKGKTMATQTATLDAKVDSAHKTAFKTTVENFKNIEGFYESTTGIGLGYKDCKDALDQWFGGDGINKIGSFLKKILGLLITAFALQLGSNYWFDLLNKVVNLRAVGKKPDEKKQ